MYENEEMQGTAEDAVLTTHVPPCWKATRGSLYFKRFQYTIQRLLCKDMDFSSFVLGANGSVLALLATVGSKDIIKKQTIPGDAVGL